MKIATLAFVLSLAVPGMTMAAEAISPTPNDVCLDAGHIDHTSVIDGQTILFYMRGGKIWKNTLPQTCPSLKFERAFGEEITGDVICSNRQMIRVLRTGTYCSLGPFTPYSVPGKPG